MLLVQQLRPLAAIAFAVVVAGCGTNDVPDPAPATTTTAPSETSVTQASEPTETSTPEPDREVEQPVAPEPDPPAPVAPQPEAAPPPVIVDCQTGLGPIQTYWSDGTVTGYSDYCQSVHDEVLRGEAEANDPENWIGDYETDLTDEEVRQFCAEGVMHPAVCDSYGY